jgi:hypothetical protein
LHLVRSAAVRRRGLLASAAALLLAASALAAAGTAWGQGAAGAAGAAVPVAPPQGIEAAAMAQGVQRMAAHRAAYRLSLAGSRDGAIAAVRGAMLFEVADACDGWATRQRLSMTLTDRDGQDIETNSDYATYESKDGRRLRFSLTQTTAGAVSQRISGEAELEQDGSGRVRYAEPAGREEALPLGTLLPMRHTIAAIEQARSGRRLLVAPLFDGTSDEGAQDTTTAITGWQAAGSAGAEAPQFPLLANLASGRMRVAFFEPGAGPGGASAPEYEVGLRYFENGVADDLRMEFGEFSVSGGLAELEPMPGGC